MPELRPLLTQGEAAATAAGLVLSMLLRRLLRYGYMSREQLTELMREAQEAAGRSAALHGEPFSCDVLSTLRAIEFFALAEPRPRKGVDEEVPPEERAGSLAPAS